MDDVHEPPSWWAYQKKVAHLFLQLGCLAEVEAPVEGARATHKIDVWVVFKRFGLEQRWAVECKNWKTPVPKEKVQALKSVVEDIGADKGILVARSGFQSGAVDAATLTNILLTTFDELKASAASDLQSILLDDLERKQITLVSRLSDLYKHEKTRQGTVSSPRPGVDSENYMRMWAVLGVLEGGFNSVKVGQFPASVGIDFDAEQPIFARSKQEFIEVSAKTIESIGLWVTEQEVAIEDKVKEYGKE